MDIEFLTQPEARVGDLIHSSIGSYGPPQELVIVSAFASLRTVLRFKPKVAEVKAAGGAVRLVLGVDLGGTSKEVLKEVASWQVPVMIVKNRMIGITFHPKLYLMRWPNRAEIIVGSNNFTEGGLYRNYEASSRTVYALPDEQAALDKASSELKRFLQPTGPTATLLSPVYLNTLLALPDIPSEAVARRARAEGIPRKPASAVFGYESIPPAPGIKEGALPQAANASLPATKSAGADSFAIQVRAHHNGEIFLSVTAALQNPAFFKWPFNGQTTPKKSGNPSYPQITPDPVVDIVVYGAAPEPLKTLSAYPLNTVYYETKSEIRITASPLVAVMPDDSVMIMRRSEAADRDYDIVIHRPDSPNYEHWLEICDQKMPGGGKKPRRFGWF
ncbi:MAG: phospholipase D family protein [Bryobacteraceae bacterium]|jgi:hypothetical protein